MTPPSPVPFFPFAERLRSPAGRRALGLGLAVLVEALMLLVLLTLGARRPPEVEPASPTTITFVTEEVAEPAPEPSPEPEQRTEQSPTEPQPPQPEPPPPLPRPEAPAPAPPPPQIELPTPFQLPPPGPRRAAPPPGPVYGPPDVRSAAMRDTERVGTAPNGEPLYAAAWYREPEEAMLRAYLSAARAPGWGMIACRTVANWRVEDCVAVGEYPEGSQIARAVLAAAWEFRVRPPRLGGRTLVGAWVRIRIDYH